MIDKYHTLAAQNGSIIVPSCGFDSIPADIGAFFISDHMQTELKQKCERLLFPANDIPE
jgi:short subunit dehydrogenase-like uncharacterized protein